MIRRGGGHRRYAVTLTALVVAVGMAAPSGMASAGQPRAAGGITLVLTPTRVVKPSDFGFLTEIVQERIDRLGVSNASLTRKGNKLIVHLFGVSDANIAALRENRISFTVAPVLRFRPVLTSLPRTHPTTAATPAATVAAAIASCDPDLVQRLLASGTDIPNSEFVSDQRNACVVLAARGSQRRLYLGKTQLTGTAVDVASTRFLNGQWTVIIHFTKTGGKKFDAVGRRNFHGQLAIVVEGVVQSAPTIQPDDAAFSSFGGTAEITGNFAQGEASNLARVVNRANKPLPFKVASVTLTGP